MLKSRYAVSAIVMALFMVVVAASSFGQDFTIQASPMNPSSINEGNSSVSTITVSSVNSTSAPTVAVSCAVTGGPPGGTQPTCSVSPTSVVAPATPTMTVTTVLATVPGTYTITVTGSDASGTLLATTTLNVIVASPQYSLSVTTAISPNTVKAGNGATAVVSIIPADGYGGANTEVTLACSNVSPAVALSPQCNFSYLSNGTLTDENPGVPVPTSAAVPVTLTITTSGPSTSTPAIESARAVSYFWWMPVAGLALIGGVAGGNGRRRRFFALFLLCAVATGLLFLPSCGTTVNGQPATGTSQTTPNNTYKFTLSAIDNSGQAASNATEVTVSLAVN